MGLAGAKTANSILGLRNSTQYFNPGLASVSWSNIEWRVTVSCSFNFSNFPFDEHKCPLELVIPFHWNPSVNNKMKDTVKYMKDGFEVKAQKFANMKKYDELSHWQSTTLGVNINLKRQLSQYVFQYYLPSITIVIASSVSFIIPLSAVPGRVALMGTQFLTLTNIFINQMVHA